MHEHSSGERDIILHGVWGNQKMAVLGVFLLALAAAAPDAAGPEGLGCVYHQLGEAGRGVVARANEDGSDAEFDAFLRANQRVLEAGTVCSERLNWKPVRNELANDYASERVVADLYQARLREAGVDDSVVEDLLGSLDDADRKRLNRTNAAALALLDERLDAYFQRQGENTDNELTSPIEVFFPLARAAGYDTEYPSQVYLDIVNLTQARFAYERDDELWKVLGDAP